jgi:hypothetical protein
MLKVFDSVCSSMGMCVNATTTELMALCHDCQPLGSVQLSGGGAQHVTSIWGGYFELGPRGVCSGNGM